MDIKKLMVLGTAVAGLTCLADVTSANIVGYTGKTLEAGKFNLISLPFAGLNAEGTSKLKEAMTGANWLGGEVPEDGDLIKVWSAENQGYLEYFYYTDDSHEWDGWWDMSISYEFDDCEENQGGLEAGWNAWYQSRGVEKPTVTMAGAVEPSDDVQFSIYEGAFNLLVNPFPTNFKPNDSTAINWGDVTGGEVPEDGDIIKLWSAKDQGYVEYFYYMDDSHEWDGWWDMSISYYFEEVEGNENGIPAGEVFWYQSRGTKGKTHKVTFYNPTK